LQFLRLKRSVVIGAIVALLISGLAGLSFAQMTQTCESCGMMVAADCQAHLKVIDSNGTFHYVDCFKCALKILKNYGDLNITSTCDWNGPSRQITVYLKDKVNITLVNPAGAFYIDGTCTKNRIVYDQAAADALLANNGTSQYITSIQNVTIPVNATVMTIAQAATMYAFTSSPDPTPSPTPSPTPMTTPTAFPIHSASPIATPTITPLKTPTPTSASSQLLTQQCEACGMEVPADAQLKYVITDETGKNHYAECFMCALNLCKNNNQLNITTYCDWYGSNYVIAVQSSNFGKDVIVNPSAALFLNGGSCVINRVAYNQTAADMLQANSFSNNTLVEQRYALPLSTKVSTVELATVTFSQNKAILNPSAIPFTLIIGVVAGVAIIVLTVVAYYKFTKKS